MKILKCDGPSCHMTTQKDDLGWIVIHEDSRLQPVDERPAISFGGEFCSTNCLEETLKAKGAASYAWEQRGLKPPVVEPSTPFGAPVF